MSVRLSFCVAKPTPFWFLKSLDYCCPTNTPLIPSPHPPPVTVPENYNPRLCKFWSLPTGIPGPQIHSTHSSQIPQIMSCLCLKPSNTLRTKFQKPYQAWEDPLSILASFPSGPETHQALSLLRSFALPHPSVGKNLPWNPKSPHPSAVNLNVNASEKEFSLKSP